MEKKENLGNYLQNKLRVSCEFIMVDVDKAIIGKLKRNEEYFEILLDPVKILEFKRGKTINIRDTLAFPAVYHDAKKGDLVSEEELQKNFGTIDVYVIADKIVREGTLQLTTEQRRELVEEKTREIANIISKRGINPQNNLPHPPERILNAMEKAGVHVDPFTDANLQINEAIKSIKALIPIEFQRVVLEILIPPQYAGKVYSMLKTTIKEFKEQWLNDGSLQVTIDIPSGMQTDLFQKIGGLTHGDFKSKTIKKVDI